VGDSRREAHEANAERAERLAEKARSRIAGVQRAIERHEQLAGDPVIGDAHRRAAAFYRDALLTYEHAVALQSVHAAHEREAAETLAARGIDSAMTRSSPSAPAISGAADAGSLRRRTLAADERERTADARQSAADERERLADTRERAADDRDAVATAREDQIGARERELDDALAYFGSDAERAAQLDRVRAAIARSRGRIVRTAQALHRYDPEFAEDAEC
jgi:hypothetical protein